MILESRIYDLRSSMSDNFFQSSYNKLVQSIKGQQLNAATAIIFVTRAMQIIEESKSLSGPEKKQIVLDLIVKLITETPMKDEPKALLLSLPYSSIIDQIVAATKNQLKINEVVDEVKKQGKACGCFGK